MRGKLLRTTFASWTPRYHSGLYSISRTKPRVSVQSTPRFEPCKAARRPELVGQLHLQNEQIVGTRTLLAPARVQGSTTPLRVRSAATPHTPTTRRDDTVALENGTIPHPTEPHHIAFLLLSEHPLYTIRPSTPPPIVHLLIPTRFGTQPFTRNRPTVCARETFGIAGGSTTRKGGG